MVLALALLLACDELSRSEVIVLATLFVLSASFHAGNLATAVLVVAAAAAWQLLVRRSATTPPLPRSRLTLAAALVLGAWLFVSATHVSFGSVFLPVRGAPAFIAGRMVENGIMDRVLAERCPDRHWKLCE